MSGCPGETELLDLVSGQLGAAQSDEIHAHVSGCPSCERMVAELARDTPGDVDPLVSAEPRELKPGESIGHYVVLERLGAGGMGVVYAAFDPQLDRKVALKVLKSDVSSKDAADQSARLLGEAQALARLSHPNVVTVYEARALAGRVWLAMELVEGTTLARWLREAQEPRTREQIVEVFVRAGMGLQAAHEAGIVHRDFKPENVLIGDDGRVRVTDFGLARRGIESEATPSGPPAGLSPTRARSRRSTITGALMGTPAYMAPEQWEGKPADARSDQFSFCVSLWEALTGVRPFAAERLQDLPEAMKRGVGPAARGQRIPKRWRRLLLRGLAANPDHRHATIGSLLHELQRDPVAPFRKPIAVFAALALLVVGVLVGGRNRSAGDDREKLCSGAEAKLIGAWDPARKTQVHAALGSAGEAWRGVEHALDAYAAKWAEMHTEACRATRVRGEQSEAMLDLRVSCLERRARDLTALTGLFLRKGALVAADAAQAAYALPHLRECAETDALAQQVKRPDDPAVRARIVEVEQDVSEVRALISAGNYVAGRDRAEAAVEKARTVPHAPTRAEVLYQLGLVKMRTGEAPQAEQALLESAWEAQAGKADRLAARARIDLVFVVGELAGRAAEASNLTAREARAALERFGGDEDLESILESNVAGVLTAQDLCEQALPHLRKALALADRAYEPDDPQRARILNNLGNTVRCVGDLDAALARHREALQLRERVLGPDHPDVAVSLTNIGNVLFSKGDFAGALPYYRRTLEVRQRTLGPASPLIAGAILNLGVDLISMGKNGEGRDHALRALKIYEEGLGKESPRLILPLSILGHVEVDLGVPREARRHLERALRLLGSREDDQTALARFNLARAMRGERGDEQRARDLALEARRYYERRRDARKTELDAIDEWLKGPRSM